MHDDRAEAFLTRLHTDSKLLANIEAASSPALRLALARAAGYEFSEKELDSVLQAARQGELSAEVLDQVAGGRPQGHSLDIHWNPGGFG